MAMGPKKVKASRTKQENDDRLIMAMQWLWSDEFEQQYKDQFGIDDEWSKRIYFDRAPPTAKDLKEFPDPLKPPPWIDSGGGKPKTVAINVTGVEVAFRGGYITAEELLQTRDGVIDHTTKMRLLKEASLLRNIAANANKGNSSPEAAGSPENIDQEEPAEEEGDNWWPDVEEGIHTFHEPLGYKACVSAVTARQEQGKLTVEGYIRTVSVSAKKTIANKAAREEQMRVEQAKAEKERRKQERRKAQLRVELEEGGEVMEDGTVRQKTNAQGEGEGSEGRYLGEVATPKAVDAAGKSSPKSSERKKLDEEFAHLFDEEVKPEAAKDVPAAEAEAEGVKKEASGDVQGKKKGKRGSMDGGPGASRGRRKSLTEGRGKRRKSVTEGEAGQRRTSVQSEATGAGSPLAVKQRGKSQVGAAEGGEGAPGKKQRGAALKEKKLEKERRKMALAESLAAADSEETEGRGERRQRSRPRKRSDAAEDEDDAAERSNLSGSSPGASEGEKAEEGGSGDGGLSSSDETDSEEDKSPEEEEEPNLSWWGWAKNDESPFRKDHCAVVDQLVHMHNQREAGRKLKETYKAENKTKGKSGFNHIMRTITVADMSADQLLKIKLDRHSFLEDERKVKHARTKNFRQLAHELERSVWGHEEKEALVHHNTGEVGDKVTISQEHKSNPLLAEFANKVGLLVRRDTDIDGWWADFTGQDGKQRRRLTQKKAAKKVEKQNMAEKLKSMRAKIKKDERAKSAEDAESRPERLFCTGHNGRFWLAHAEEAAEAAPVDEGDKAEPRRVTSGKQQNQPKGSRARARNTQRQEAMISERIQHIKERAGLVTPPKTSGTGGKSTAKSGGGGQSSRLNSPVASGTHRRSLDVSTLAIMEAAPDEPPLSRTASEEKSVVQFASIPSSPGSVSNALPALVPDKILPSPMLPPIARVTEVRSKLILDHDEESSFRNLDV